MRNITLLAVALLSTAFITAQEYLRMIDAGTYKVQEVIDSANAYFENRDTGRGSGYKQFKRWEYNALRMVQEDGYLSTVTENMTEFENYNAYLNQTAGSRSATNDNWVELGPDYWDATTSWNPGVGRITGIAIDPTNEDHIIVGANTGGVWKSLDGGQSWTALNDFFSNLYVYSVTMDPQNSNIYYFGSSSGIIFKSTDAGATWTQIADMSNSLINKIAIHPTNSDIMFACSQNAGIYRSTDGGATWNNTGIDSNAYDVEFKPGDPNTVYASGLGFHKSVDGGQTFSTISGFDSGPKMIGVSPDGPEVVYVAESDGGTFNGFYSSSDSGNSFAELPHGSNNYFGYSTSASDNSGQAPRDMDIVVNPENVNEVHIAGIITWRSTNGGATFNVTAAWTPGEAASLNIGYHHADVDILLFYGSTLYAGTDGGIFKCVDTANVTTDYYEDLTTGMGIRQWYKIGVTQTPEVVVTGGSQDNGSSFYTEAGGWKDWIGADGMEGFVDKDNSDIMYGMIQFGRMYRTETAGTSIINVNEPGPGGGNWVTPFEQDPIQTNVIYVGYDRVYKSVNKGNTWTSISQNFGGSLDNLKIAESDNQVMYASRGGLLYRTDDGGATNWQVTNNAGGSINSIAIHPSDPNRIAVATTSGNRVLVSIDGGQTWENYRKNLPNFSSLAVVWQEGNVNGLYVGMDYGLYYIDDTMDDWIPYNNNLPNVIINELEINYVDGNIYAGTYGRGLWASPIKEETILGTNELISSEQVSIYPNPANDSFRVGMRFNLDAQLRIFDLNGKLLQYHTDVDSSSEIDVSSLEVGVYFVRIQTERGSVTKKLIRQ